MTVEKRRLARVFDSIGVCGPQAAAYGRCVSDQIAETRKDMCLEEFKLFKECVTRAVGRRW